MKPDIVVEIHHPAEEPGACIYTNAKREALEEILEAWLRDTAPRPRRPDEFTDPAKVPVFILRIGLRLEDDAFAHESNCRNIDLLLGIGLSVLGQVQKDLANLDVRPLSERPVTERLQ